MSLEKLISNPPFLIDKSSFTADLKAKQSQIMASLNDAIKANYDAIDDLQKQDVIRKEQVKQLIEQQKLRKANYDQDIMRFCRQIKY